MSVYLCLACVYVCRYVCMCVVVYECGVRVRRVDSDFSLSVGPVHVRFT